jgi:hypothetical protein
MKNPLLLLAFIAMAAVSFSFTTPPARRASSKKVYNPEDAGSYAQQVAYLPGSGQQERHPR